MSEIEIWIGDDSNYMADSSDWYELIDEMAYGGCVCQLRGTPSPKMTNAKSPELIFSLIVTPGIVKAIANALIKFYEVKHHAKVVLARKGQKIEITGVASPDAIALIDEFMGARPSRND